MENALVNLKNQCEDFEVEFEVLPAIDITQYQDKRRSMIQEGLSDVEDQLAAVQAKIEEYNTEIDRLTNQADGVDYAIAVTCGLVTGILDAVFVGEWDFGKAKATSNKAINEKVIEFAKKDPDYEDFVMRKRSTDKKDVNRLDNAIQFLESKYKLPGDGNYKPFTDEKVTNFTHHLDDFCHHPTLVGLVCCILVQFTGTATYYPSTGPKIQVQGIEVNQYGNFASYDSVGKVFAGVLNWFFAVAKNRKGHLISDMAGSIGSVAKGNSGMGLPGSFLSTLKELSALRCFQKTNFAEDLRKAYQNGIGTGKSQVDLGVFNGLFQGASSKFDMRTEMAIGHELKRQSIPVIINEALVRGAYFVRRFIDQMKEKESIREVDWKPLLPAKNRTIVRMMTIASGTFTAVDMADAAIHAAGKSGGTVAGFAAQMVLRVNFVGVGRFAVAVATDAGMGVKRSIARNKRIELYTQQLALTNAKVFYKEADMWISAQDTGKSIEEACAMAEKATAFYWECMRDISESLEHTGEYISEIGENNPDFLEKMKDILEWG